MKKNKYSRISWLLYVLVFQSFLIFQIGNATTYYVAPNGVNTNSGTLSNPFLTIQKAVDMMQAGDICYIRTGTYREYINPPRGGSSETQRIVYQAYPGETPVIKGSEKIAGWTQQSGNTWKVDLPDLYFGTFNPFTQAVTYHTSDWISYGKTTPLGEVYFNDVSYKNKNSLNEVTSTANTWYSSHSGTTTTIYANFGGSNPNNGLAEINVRELIFFPTTKGLKYITVNGLTMKHAATAWAPPNVLQYGLIGTWWGTHWIIENCHISDSKCVGICSGNAGVSYSDIESFGYNIIRNNIIERCGQAGISGQYNHADGLIENNLIQDINYKKEFGGFETAGIKVHYGVDLVIKNNVIRRVHNLQPNYGGMYPGIWLDWANQGIRVTGNVIYDCDENPLYIEANHGPVLVDNNIMMGYPDRNQSSRVVFVHNLMFNSGHTYITADDRTPEWFLPHTFQRVSSAEWSAIGYRYFNNIYIKFGVDTWNHSPRTPVKSPTDISGGYNSYYEGYSAPSWDATSANGSSFVTGFSKTDLSTGVQINFNLNSSTFNISCPLITYNFIGQYSTVNQGIEYHDGTGITIDKDIMGNARSSSHPKPGPFETIISGANNFSILAGPSTGPTHIDKSIIAHYSHIGKYYGSGTLFDLKGLLISRRVNNGPGWKNSPFHSKTGLQGVYIFIREENNRKIAEKRIEIP